VRESVRSATIARQGNRCAFHTLGRCDYSRRLEVHEMIRRSDRPGSHLDARVTIALCPYHHALDAGRRGESWGIRCPEWAERRYSTAAVLAEMYLIRQHRLAGRTPSPPFWDADRVLDHHLAGEP
jgi:hypothetical protein